MSEGRPPSSGTHRQRRYARMHEGRVTTTETDRHFDISRCCKSGHGVRSPRPRLIATLTYQVAQYKSGHGVRSLRTRLIVTLTGISSCSVQVRSWVRSLQPRLVATLTYQVAQVKSGHGVRSPRLRLLATLTYQVAQYKVRSRGEVITTDTDHYCDIATCSVYVRS